MSEWRSHYIKYIYGLGSWYMDYPIAIVNNKIAILRYIVKGKQSIVKLQNFYRKKNEYGQYLEEAETSFVYDMNRLYQQIRGDMTDGNITSFHAEYHPDTKTFHWGSGASDALDFDTYVQHWFDSTFNWFLRVDAKEGRRNRYRTFGKYTIRQWSFIAPIVKEGMIILVREIVHKIRTEIDELYAKQQEEKVTQV